MMAIILFTGSSVRSIGLSFHRFDISISRPELFEMKYSTVQYCTIYTQYMIRKTPSKTRE